MIQTQCLVSLQTEELQLSLALHTSDCKNGDGESLKANQVISMLTVSAVQICIEPSQY